MPADCGGAGWTSVPQYSPEAPMKPIVTSSLTAMFLAVPVGTLFLLGGCQSSESVSPSSDDPVLARAPATGNGNKFVVPVDEEFPVDCGGEQLTGSVTGWFQGRFFSQPRNPNVELDVFHFLWTFTNSGGETFTFHDVGPNRVHFDPKTGELFLELTGRVAGAIIGHLTINLNTGEVEFAAGQDVGGLEALACEALT
jgi:hypothetical protein